VSVRTPGFEACVEKHRQATRQPCRKLRESYAVIASTICMRVTGGAVFLEGVFWCPKAKR